MVRSLVAYLLIAAVMSASFSRLFVYAGFDLNRGYIASHLCENRDKPWLHCNGTCYFMKKMKQAEEKEKNEERQSQKNLFQEGLFAQKTETRFYLHVLQVIPVPNRRFTLPIADLPVYQPPRLG